MIARLLLAAVMAAAPSPAGSRAAPAQGWWTVANPGLPGAPAASAPDVPSNGLLVESGGASAPVAYAAVVYQVPAGTAPDTLTLTVAPGSATTPAATLQLCPLATPTIKAAHGGPMSDAPKYDCSRKASAAPSPDGKQYRFSVAGLIAGSDLAVAILPTAPSDRVVLAGVDAAAFTHQQAAASPPTTAPDNSAPPASPPHTASAGMSGGPSGADAGPASPPPVASDALSSSAGLPSSSASSPPPPGPSPAAAAAASPTPPAALSAPAGTPQALAVAATTPDPSAAKSAAVGLAIAGVLGAAALWAYAGRREETSPIGEEPSQV